MGRQKKSSYKYEDTAFAKRINELQLKYGYTDEEVLNKLEQENCPIANVQTYASYKSGKRQPRDFDIMLAAFSRIYGVTAGYLIGTEDVPNPQIKSVQDATGLSETAAAALMRLKDGTVNLLPLTDTILSAMEGENVWLYSDIFQQMYRDYSDSLKAGCSKKPSDSEKTGTAQDFFSEREHMNYMRLHIITRIYQLWYETMAAKMPWVFEAEREKEEARLEYACSPEGVADMIAGYEESERYLTEHGPAAPEPTEQPKNK